MLRLTAVVVGILIVLGGIALAPTTIGAEQRRAVAVAAVQHGMAGIGVALLKPLAAAGDAAALNDLGVLTNRGNGVAEDPVEAARLLNAAADAGSKRAALNLVLIRTPCDSQWQKEATARLTEFARAGDRRAASFVADCLTWGGDLRDGDRAMLMLEAGEIATGGGDPVEELKFGFLFLKQLRFFENAVGIDHQRKAMARAAADYLLRAAEHGEAAGYEGVGILADKYSRLLGSDPIAEKVAAKSKDGWIAAAALAGQPKSQCLYGATLAKKFESDPPAMDKAERGLLQKLFVSCLSHRNNPRKIIFKDGKSQTLGYDPTYDYWMKEEPFLVMTPRYDGHDYDEAEQDIALHKMLKVAEGK